VLTPVEYQANILVLIQVAAYQLIAEIFHEAQTRRQKLIIIFWV
jgi:hypothetical protein